MEPHFLPTFTPQPKLMRQLLLTAILITTLFSCSTNKDDIPIPPTTQLHIDSVKAKFYTTYDMASVPMMTVAFEKRRGGWYIGTYSSNNGKYVVEKRHLFYSDSLKVYLDLPFDKLQDSRESQFEAYYDPSDHYNYKANYYYGYVGWYNDVISALEDRENLTDDQLYALARAYSMSASARLGNQGGYTVPSDNIPAALVQNSFSQEQIKDYHRRIDKAIAAFDQLRKRNPKFESRVGLIGLKYAHEVMSKLHNTIVFGDKYINDVQIPDGLYHDTTINHVKKVLDACEPNSILVSFGDNDFYPVLYVQHKLNHRKDVYLINHNLINIDVYIARLQYPQFTSPGIKLSADTTLYRQMANDYVQLAATNEPVAFADLLNRMRSSEKLPLQSRTNNTYGIKLNANTPPIYLTRGYLLKNDWVLLDIVANLQGRKIYFSEPSYGIDHLENLIERGALVSRFKN
jgi:hypothetical protein